MLQEQTYFLLIIYLSQNRQDIEPMWVGRRDASKHSKLKLMRQKHWTAAVKAKSILRQLLPLQFPTGKTEDGKSILGGTVVKERENHVLLFL